MSSNLEGVMTALRTGGADVMVRTNGDWGYCAALGTGGQWLVEQAACADLAAVEAFFREQGAVHFPNVVLP